MHIVVSPAQRFHELLRLGIPRRIHCQPMIRDIDPGMGRAPARQRAGHQLIHHLHFEVAHLFATDRSPLLRGNRHRPIRRFLADNGCRQQFLLHGQGQQPLALLLVEETTIVTRTDPAGTFHLESAAGLQRLLREFLFQCVGIDGPVRRQTVQHKILKPHEEDKKRPIIRTPGTGEQRPPGSLSPEMLSFRPEQDSGTGINLPRRPWARQWSPSWTWQCHGHKCGHRTRYQMRPAVCQSLFR